MHFGNVTTVQAVTYATSAHWRLKKVEHACYRKIPARTSGSSFTTSRLTATNDAAEIISAICLDTYIGNRQIAEIDFNAIYDRNTYFGSDKAAEFCYTFDSDNLSFEETVKAVADAVFCTAYRRGNIIKLSFEKRKRKIRPCFSIIGTNSVQKQERFGSAIKITSTAFLLNISTPEDDAQVTYYIPEDRSAVNPKRI